MAQGAFVTQVEGLTGLTISGSGTSPTQPQLTNYLVDGVRDVACRVMAIKPGEASLFSRTTSGIVHNNGTSVDSGIVLDVVRTDGVTSGNLIPADPISMAQRYQATDTDSLYYRSNFNPGWYIKDKVVYIVPAPADNSGKDDAFITYVDFDDGILYSDATSAIDYFPDKYQGLVVLYASCRSLLNAMGNTLTNLTAYAAPVISSTAGGGTAAVDLTTMTDSDWASLDFDFDDENIDFATWFQAAGNMIQKQEDFELASAQLEKITTYIAGYQASVTNSTTVFDKNFQKYSADYQWMADRHQRLYGEYTGYFNIMMGQKQADQQAAQAQQQGGRR